MGRAHGQIPRTAAIFDRDRDPDRPLRIGWLSRDFGRHILSRFLVPILVHHDPLLVHSHIYADLLESDDLAQAIRRYATEWSSVGGMPDDRSRGASATIASIFWSISTGIADGGSESSRIDPRPFKFPISATPTLLDFPRSTSG